MEVKEPRFSELNKVRINDGENDAYEGYVISSQFDNGRWVYEISVLEDPPSKGTWDNWAPEEWLTLIK